MSNFYLDGLTALSINGSELEVRGSKTKEIINHKLTIDPYECLSVRFNKDKKLLKYLLAELAWYFSGDSSVKFISRYASLWNRIKDKDGKVTSNYGRHIFRDKYRYYTNGTYDKYRTQFQFVIDTLKADLYSRQAVISLRSADNTNNPKDNMCTLSIQFLYRNGLLHMIVNMRSNDIVYGLTYDAPFFALLQLLVAQELGVNTGYYQHIAGSFHIYEKHYEELEIKSMEYYYHVKPHSIREFIDETFNLENLMSDFKYTKNILEARRTNYGMFLTPKFKTKLVEWLWGLYNEGSMQCENRE